jgi:hypothetical protein
MGILQSLVLLATAMFWVFMLWMFWKIVQALVGLDQTLKDIANSLRERDGEKL